LLTARLLRLAIAADTQTQLFCRNDKAVGYPILRHVPHRCSCYKQTPTITGGFVLHERPGTKLHRLKSQFKQAIADPANKSFNFSSKDIYVIFIYLSPNDWFICSSSKDQSHPFYRETGKLI